MEKNTNILEDELDLSKLFKTILSDKKMIIRFVIVFGCIGSFIAIFSAKQYTASTTLVPQTSQGKTGSLGGLAALAGINLGTGSTESISPNLYPKITESILFKKELLNTPLTFSGIDKDITYQEYYLEHQKINVLSFMKQYTIGLPGKLLGLFKSKKVAHQEVVNNIYRVSLEEMNLFQSIERQLALDINTKEGFVQVSFSMPEALPAAQMTQKVKELLQNSVTDFKIQKTKEEFLFIEERYKELKIDFEKKQAALANFRDRNQGLATSRSKSRLERLQSAYNLAFSVYSELAKQLESQKIKLKENTPIFTVVQPVSVPVTKSKPKRVIILIIWLFLGAFLGIVSVIGKSFYINMKNDIDSY